MTAPRILIVEDETALAEVVRDYLIAHAFPDDTEVYDRTIDSHIRNIRRKIAPISDADPIRSVYGVGYAYES